VHVPDPLAPPTPAFTRRQGLAAVALLGPLGLLAACSSSDEPAASSTAAAATSPTEAVVREEEALIEAYETALAALPDLPASTAALLATIRDQHAQHRDALGGGSGTTAAPRPTGETTAAATLAALATAERDAARSRIRACVAAEDPELARLLAFVAASESAHVPALRGAEQ
jgi:hypothetical protein